MWCCHLHPFKVQCWIYKASSLPSQVIEKTSPVYLYKNTINILANSYINCHLYIYKATVYDFMFSSAAGIYFCYPHYSLLL